MALLLFTTSILSNDVKRYISVLSDNGRGYAPQAAFKAASTPRPGIRVQEPPL
jgi:hypothetical protein